mmetsp:Transcript_123483/g.345735  ORF Transcript_123483/g.345735 Transcript_123483/m.345735 type:complete len:291 (-) Transcript_123483:521-1393(-)
MASPAAFSSASLIMRSTSLLSSVEEPAMVMVCSLLVPLSFAPTLKMPFASMSKVTSIWGTPLLAAGTPSSLKVPKILLSLANCRSPCKTTISTEDCESVAVENTSVFFVGIVVFLGMSTVATPPSVSTPNESGVTSKRTMSFTSPAKTPACTAAPTATTSSGLTLRFGSLPFTRSLASCWMAGMRVDPPTSTISSISAGPSLASSSACSTGVRHRCTRPPTICSNLDRVKVSSMCFGPVASAVMKGREIFASWTLESSIFALSAASVKRWRACRSLSRSTPSDFLKAPAR